MVTFEKFKEQAQRVLSIPSHWESGNEELVRYLQSIMHDFGYKTVMQPVNHSSDRISKRQFNLIGYTADTLVDRTTRRGVLFINPLDVTTGNLPQLWTATQGNPNGVVATELGIVGLGAVQGKLDYLCRVHAGLALLDKRHKNPIYLVGAATSHFGMAGSRFLAESLAVNPKSVYSFAPTEMHQCKQGAGHVSYTIDVETLAKDRDARGYNRSVEITAFGLSADLSSPHNAINAFELMMDLLLDATANGFDFQWSNIEVKGAEGATPDLANAKIYLTAFQFEDFRQFIKNKLDHEEKQRFFSVEYTGVNEVGSKFIPNALVELILELDFEWKNFIKRLNQKPNQNFIQPVSIGALTRIQGKNNGKIGITFELRYLPNHAFAEVDQLWREKLKEISEKYKSFHFHALRDYMVPGLLFEESSQSKNTNYLSDAGIFNKLKFPVNVLGAGSLENMPKAPNEAIRWDELEKAISIYQDLMITVSN
jgi:acetylornithine deacetylase/succinyl-diaminopimelate desuccinylase-like protein